MFAFVWAKGPHTNHQQYVGRLLRRSRGRAVVEEGTDGTGRGGLSGTIIRLNRWGLRTRITRNYLSVGDRTADDHRERMHFRQQST